MQLGPFRVDFLKKEEFTVFTLLKHLDVMPGLVHLEWGESYFNWLFQLLNGCSFAQEGDQLGQGPLG